VKNSSPPGHLLSYPHIFIMDTRQITVGVVITFHDPATRDPRIRVLADNADLWTPQASVALYPERTQKEQSFRDVKKSWDSDACGCTFGSPKGRGGFSGPSALAYALLGDTAV
jgi:hypothetical protein